MLYITHLLSSFKSNIHEESYKAWKRRQLLDRGEGVGIDQSLCPEYDDVANENKSYIVMLLKYVLWFATKEIPTRGNDGTAESSSRVK